MNFVKALVNRWEYKVDYNYESGTEDHYNYFKELVQIERDILAKYKDAEFEDSRLQTLATSYINGLDKQDEALSYLLSNYDYYRSRWNEARDQRAICIKNIYDEVDGFEVPVTHKNILNHMLSAAYISLNNDAVYALLNNPIKNGDYVLEGSVLKVDIVNTTDYEFQYVTVYADLYSGNTYVGYGEVDVESWKPDEVYNFVFTLDAGSSFDFIEITTN